MRTVLNSVSRADSERSPLHDVKQHTLPRRTWAEREIFITSGRAKRAVASATLGFFAHPTIGPSPPALVEPDGIEPTTSCLQSRRSPN